MMELSQTILIAFRGNALDNDALGDLCVNLLDSEAVEETIPFVGLSWQDVTVF